VLPESFTVGANADGAAYTSAAEPAGGMAEQRLCALAKSGGGYVVGSYPERDGASVYHTVALAGPDGKVLTRYRASHLPPNQTQWAKEGNDWTVVPTPIGRIGLALGEELSVPEPPSGSSEIETQITIAWPGTWMNQTHLIDGQRPATTLPITLDPASPCFQQWANAPGWKYGC